MYGEATDPMPFLLASYLLGFVLILGYSGWLYIQRRQVQRYLAAIQNDSRKV